MNLHIVFAAASLLLSQAHIDAVERLRGVTDPGTTEAGEPWPAASELPAELKDLWGEHVDERYAAATSRIDSIAQPMPEHVRESLDASISGLPEEIRLAMIDQASVPWRSGPIGWAAAFRAVYEQLSPGDQATMRGWAANVTEEEEDALLG